MYFVHLGVNGLTRSPQPIKWTAHFSPGSWPFWARASAGAWSPAHVLGLLRPPGGRHHNWRKKLVPKSYVAVSFPSPLPPSNLPSPLLSLSPLSFPSPLLPLSPLPLPLPSPPLSPYPFPSVFLRFSSVHPSVHPFVPRPPDPLSLIPPGAAPSSVPPSLPPLPPSPATPHSQGRLIPAWSLLACSFNAQGGATRRRCWRPTLIAQRSSGSWVSTPRGFTISWPSPAGGRRGGPVGQSRRPPPVRTTLVWPSSGGSWRESRHRRKKLSRSSSTWYAGLPFFHSRPQALPSFRL